MRTLDEHGGGCRCLLRLHENEGRPGISDAAFLERFLPRYPDWRVHPGATDVAMLAELARELHLAARIEVFRDYDRLLQEHRAARSILVLTERAPEQSASEPAVRRFTLLVVAMDPEGFTLWCPYASGGSDTLARAARGWWDRWLAIGVVLYRAPA